MKLEKSGFAKDGIYFNRLLALEAAKSCICPTGEDYPTSEAISKYLSTANPVVSIKPATVQGYFAGDRSKRHRIPAEKVCPLAKALKSDGAIFHVVGLECVVQSIEKIPPYPVSSLDKIQFFMSVTFIALIVGALNEFMADRLSLAFMPAMTAAVVAWVQLTAIAGAQQKFLVQVPAKMIVHTIFITAFLGVLLLLVLWGREQVGSDDNSFDDIYTAVAMGTQYLVVAALMYLYCLTGSITDGFKRSVFLGPALLLIILGTNFIYAVLGSEHVLTQ